MKNTKTLVKTRNSFLLLPTKVRLVALAVFLGFGAPAFGSERQVLRGLLPAAAARVAPVGRLPGSQRLNLAIGLPLRNQAVLSNLLRQLYDPASPDYQQYLTPEQFTERFGPTEQDYQALVAFARASGLAVVVLVGVSTAADAYDAFIPTGVAPHFVITAVAAGVVA